MRTPYKQLEFVDFDDKLDATETRFLRMNLRDNEY
jgi:hypothetical protein